jgi:hypothetical protein
MGMMRCKNCRELFEPIRFNQKYCLDDECIKIWVQIEKEKQWQKKKAVLKNELKTMSDYMKLAQQIFNKYIRMRDSGKSCISCDKILVGKFDAGHYYSTRHKSTTFDEDNVHGQCVTCNQHMHGNLLNYQIGIERRIGGEKLFELYEKAHKEKKYTINELKQIIEQYKLRIKNAEK